MQHASRYALALAALVLAFALIQHTPWATAAGGTDTVTACRTILTGTLRQITSGSCTPVTETPVTWRVGPEDGTEFPFVCSNCSMPGIDRLAGRNLTDAWLQSAYMRDAVFTGSNFTGANMQYVNLANAQLGSAVLTNVDFTGAYLAGATGIVTSSVSGVTWSSTYCPDGTNSDDDGGTCLNHLSP